MKQIDDLARLLKIREMRADRAARELAAAEALATQAAAAAEEAGTEHEVVLSKLRVAELDRYPPKASCISGSDLQKCGLAADRLRASEADTGQICLQLQYRRQAADDQVKECAQKRNKLRKVAIQMEATLEILSSEETSS